MAEVALVNGNGNPPGFNSAMAEMIEIFKGPFSSSGKERLLELSDVIRGVERKNGSETLERLAKGTMRVLTDGQFSCLYETNTSSLWSNANGSLVLEVGYKDPISLAKKCLIYKTKGPENGDGRLSGYNDGIINDVYRMRLIVDGSKYDAYDVSRRIITFVEVLGIKDYFRNPKTNGYSAIHVIGVPKCSIERGEPILVEIQIRTKKAHEWAENGGASHFLYKKEQEKRLMN